LITFRQSSTNKTGIDDQSDEIKHDNDNTVTVGLRWLSQFDPVIMIYLTLLQVLGQYVWFREILPDLVLIMIQVSVPWFWTSNRAPARFQFYWRIADKIENELGPDYRVNYSTLVLTVQKEGASDYFLRYTYDGVKKRSKGFLKFKRSFFSPFGRLLLKKKRQRSTKKWYVQKMNCSLQTHH